MNKTNTIIDEVNMVEDMPDRQVEEIIKSASEKAYKQYKEVFQALGGNKEAERKLKQK